VPPCSSDAYADAEEFDSSCFRRRAGQRPGEIRDGVIVDGNATSREEPGRGARLRAEEDECLQFALPHIVSCFQLVTYRSTVHSSQSF